MAFFQGASNSPLSKERNARHFTISVPALSQDGRRGAPYHGARVVPPARPLPVLPRAGTAHSPAAQPPPPTLPASSASPPFWLLPPVQAPSPEVDIAARLRGRGGGGSASGETGPGLVFVNLPRSRQGSGGHGAGTVC